MTSAGFALKVQEAKQPEYFWASLWFLSSHSQQLGQGLPSGSPKNEEDRRANTSAGSLEGAAVNIVQAVANNLHPTDRAGACSQDSDASTWKVVDSESEAINAVGKRSLQVKMMRDASVVCGSGVLDSLALREAIRGLQYACFGLNKFMVLVSRRHRVGGIGKLQLSVCGI